VWTGSMNFTLSDAYGNRNNLVRIRSSALAENFLTEFEEMFNYHQFGPSSPANTPYPMVEIDGHMVETYFSPEDGTLARLVTLVDEAKESIYFMAFSFTSDDLAAALLRARDRGVEIQGILDKAQALSNQGGEFQNLTNNGIDVQLDGEGGNMHHKVLIIDRGIVVTGSYNFSAGAERQNDENTLIIHSEDIAQEFLAEFSRIREFAE
ncbi:MAG: phospholipase D-like domain-containing protein, partial [Anaerolineales bacterium]